MVSTSMLGHRCPATVRILEFVLHSRLVLETGESIQKSHFWDEWLKVEVGYKIESTNLYHCS